MKDISQNNQDARQTSSRINVWKNPQVNTSESNCQIPNTDNLESKQRKVTYQIQRILNKNNI